MDEFTKAYIECALWSSTDESGEPLDGLYTVEDIVPDSIKSMEADCQDFQEAHQELLSGLSSEQAGQDFWLTRNRHGAGFWDRGLGELGCHQDYAEPVELPLQ